MKRINIKEAAQIAIKAPHRAGKMKCDEMTELISMIKAGEVFEALLDAYNAGYYRGADAAKRGHFDPSAARRIFNQTTQTQQAACK